MDETTKIIDEELKQEVKAEEETEMVIEKPYTFKKLSSKDVFLMFNIISKIGITEFTNCMENVNVLKTIKDMSEEEKASETGVMVAAGSVALEIANVILGNIGKCEKDIYQLLSQTSNLSVKEITAEGNAVLFFEMVIDFIKKEEFPDFIKVVSRLFK